MRIVNHGIKPKNYNHGSNGLVLRTLINKETTVKEMLQCIRLQFYDADLSPFCDYKCGSKEIRGFFNDWFYTQEDNNNLAMELNNFNGLLSPDLPDNAYDSWIYFSIEFN